MHNPLSRLLLLVASVALFGCKEEVTNPQDGAPGVPPVPTRTSPASGATNIANPPTLVWGAVTGASGYAVQVSTGDSFATVAYGDSNVTSTNREVTGLNNNTRYYWRVRATSAYGTSGWSTPAWEFTTGMSCPGTPTVTYAGKTYTTVQVGAQCWLRENLDVGTMVPGSQNQANNGAIEKYCYNDSLANCATYGGLYQWNEAMQYASNEGTQGICPPGWHMPTLAEFQTLSSAVGTDGNALKAIGQGTGGGAGTNTSGFSALLAGGRGSNGYFYNLGFYGYFWGSAQYDATYAHGLYLYYNDASIGLNYFNKTYGFSVRCLKD